MEFTITIFSLTKTDEQLQGEVSVHSVGLYPTTFLDTPQKKNYEDASRIASKSDG